MPVSMNNTQVVFNDTTAQTTAGVTSIVAGTGISSSGGLTPTIANTGVTSVAAGTGISVSASTGGVTITNTGITSAVTSLNGATGAITNNTLGAISSYTSGSLNDGSAGQQTGNTFAGSSITRQNFQDGNYYGVGLSGTWRLLGGAGASSTGDVTSGKVAGNSLLFIRIS